MEAGASRWEYVEVTVEYRGGQKIEVYLKVEAKWRF